MTVIGRQFGTELGFIGSGFGVLFVASQALALRDYLHVLRRSRNAEAELRERTALLAEIFSRAPLGIARIGDDFLDDVTKALSPNTVAVVAEIEEDWTTPVDTRMEAIGGTVFRRALSEVRDTVNHEEVAAMKADLAQMKAEYAQAQADRKGKLLEKINRLDSKIEGLLAKAKDRRQAAERQAQTKAQILKSKARAAQANP